MNKDRKVIFECYSGSHLYGTNRPESDIDFTGIFLPSSIDLFSLQNCPTEWSLNEKLSNGTRNSAGDIDRKYYSLQKFLSLASEGQPKQLEMLFAPIKSYIIPSRPKKDEWTEILNKRELFVSKSSILPFIGFAKAQAYKASCKGENLVLIRTVLDYLIKYKNPNCKLKEALVNFTDLKKTTTDGGEECYLIAGRKYEYTCSVKNVIKSLLELLSKYGSRSESAAENGYDYKSLMHAYRLLFEAEELLKKGSLTLPLPKDQIDFLLAIREGKYKVDYFQEIEDKLTFLRTINSPLPEKINRSKIESLCQTLLYNHFYK